MEKKHEGNNKIHEKRLDEINDIAVENTVYHVAQPARNNKHKADVGENGLYPAYHQQHETDDENEHGKDGEQHGVIRKRAERRAGILNIPELKQTEKEFERSVRLNGGDRRIFGQAINDRQGRYDCKRYRLKHIDLTNRLFIKRGCQTATKYRRHHRHRPLLRRLSRRDQP